MTSLGAALPKGKARCAGKAMRGRAIRPEPFDMGAERADESPSLSRFRREGESAPADDAQGYGSAGFFGATPINDAATPKQGPPYGSSFPRRRE
jgi:hypothetical protein